MFEPSTGRSLSQANTKLMATHGTNYTVGCGLCLLPPPTSGVSSDWVADKLKVQHMQIQI